jgi:hypothetical protein
MSSVFPVKPLLPALCPRRPDIWTRNQEPPMNQYFSVFATKICNALVYSKKAAPVHQNYQFFFEKHKTQRFQHVDFRSDEPPED